VSCYRDKLSEKNASPKEAQMAWKKAASSFLKPFINNNYEALHTTDASYRMSGT